MQLLNSIKKTKIIHLYEHSAKQNGRNDSKKDFFMLMNNAVFRKTM